jgi:protein-tyrosine-phosphatase
MAQGVLQHLLDEAGVTALEVRTAGVMTIPGLMPTQECRQLLLKDNIDISGHRSHQLTIEMIKQAKLVLGMTSFHVQMALRMTECARGKTFLLKEYTGSDPKNGQIQDPMGCTLEVYKKVYREIKAGCKRLVKMDLLGAPHAPTRGRAAAHRKALKKTAGKEQEEAAQEMRESKPTPKKTEAPTRADAPKKAAVAAEVKAPVGKTVKAPPVKPAPERVAQITGGARKAPEAQKVSDGKPVKVSVAKAPTPAKPVAGKPAAPKPLAGKPAPARPVDSKPAAPKPAAPKPAAPKPAAPKPAPAKPAVPKPAAPKPAPAKPVASKLAAAKPAVPKPAVPKPAVPKPAAALKPAAPKPAPAKPVASKLAAAKPVVPKPAVPKPAAALKPAARGKKPVPNVKKPAAPAASRKERK